MRYEKMRATEWDFQNQIPMCPNQGAFEVIFNRHTYFIMDGKIHKEDGPAWVGSDGEQHYYYYGKLHREDGPAAIRADGTKEYYLHDLRHRDDGPALIFPDGEEYYYLFGQEYSKEDWEPLSIQLSLKEQIV